MIRISEVLPNPAGNDRDGEYIILVNDGEEKQSLAGWKIKDKSGKEFLLSGYSIEAGEGLRFPFSVSKLTLNNSDEEIELLNPASEVVDRLTYSGQAIEGVAILQNAQISEELKKELFEDLADSGRTVDNYGVSPVGISFWLVSVALVLILSGAAIYLIKKINYKK